MTPQKPQWKLVSCKTIHHLPEDSSEEAQRLPSRDIDL